MKINLHIIIAFIFECCFINFVSMAVIPTSAKDNHLQPRIVGGLPAKRGQFPYQVMIYKDGKKHCGGSILNADHIITAAHCVVKNGEIVHPSRYIVKAGDVNLLSPEIESFPVSKIFVNKRFKPKTFDNDIAVLKLGLPFHMEPGVYEAVVLDKETVPDGTICVVSGWGTQRLNTTEMPDQLYYADVEVINRKICEVKYENFNTVSRNMVCAGYENGSKDACEGDSGGPLMCGNKLAGVVSWGIGCGLAEFPGVYTNIAKQRDWILSVIRQ